MIHDLVITQAYFQVGQLIAPTQITFTTEDGGELAWSGMVTRHDEPVVVDVPGDGTLYIEHDPMASVSISHKEHLMRTTRCTFEEVKLTVKAKAPCGKCGKMCSRTKVFSQTLNPFNTKDDGSVKNRDDIMVELNAQAAIYRTQTIYHQKWED